MSETKKGMDVFVNDKFIGFVCYQSKKARLDVIKKLIKSTHMGSWHKTAKGIEYATTIGVYVRFEHCKRISDLLGNYRIDFEKESK